MRSLYFDRYMERLNMRRDHERKVRIWTLSIISFILLSLGLFLFLYYHTSKVHVCVSSVRWEWQIEVERFKAVRYERESGYPPSDAYDVHTWTVSTPVFDSDGIFQYNDDEDFCSYTMNEWAHERWLAAGGLDKKPHWPSTSEINAKPPEEPLVIEGQWERQGRSVKRYVLLLTNFDLSDKKHWEYEVPESTWEIVRANQLHEIEVNHFGEIRAFHFLKQADVPRILEGE